MSDFPDVLRDVLKPLPLAGAVAALLSLLVALIDARQAMSGWLVAATFWVGLPVGALAWVMVHHLTGGRWGAIARPSLEAAAVTFPAMALLLLPPLVLCGVTYPWGNAAMVDASETLGHQQAWMWPPWVWLRTLAYVGVGTLYVFRFWKTRTTLAAWAGPGLVLLAVLGSFASLDFLMTRTVGYVSSIFGFIALVGAAYSAWAIVTFDRADDADASDDRRNDLGSLLATMALLWAYVSFMQFLISWLGNLLPEATWYVDRGLGGIEPNAWRWVGLALFLLGFALPFGAMLFRAIKRHPTRLKAVAAIAIAGRIIDCLWLAGPSGMKSGFGIWSIVVATLALVGFGLVWWPLWLGLRAITPPVIVEPFAPKEEARVASA